METICYFCFVCPNKVPKRQKMVNVSACVADDDACRRILLEHEREREGKLRDIAASLTQPRARRIKPRTSEPTRDVVDAANAAYQDKFVSDFCIFLKSSFYVVFKILSEV